MYIVLDDVMERYGELFKDELGTVQDYSVKLVLKQNAKPRFSDQGLFLMP